jgi:23S rRNA (cytosine1962-C5)-methyltransferase
MVRSTVAGAVLLRPGRERRILAGHLWIFEGEVADLRGTPRPGEFVDVLAHDGRFCGRGFYNPTSKIRVRVLTFQDEPLDEAFFGRRIRDAVALRSRVVSGTTAYRVVYAEGDLLPGLIVDRYGELLVMQTLALGMDVRKELLADLLLQETGAQAVYLRNDSGIRSLEGLPRHQGFLRGEAPTRLEIREGQARFWVDVERGQKTGWFCDQRENRLTAAPLGQDADVLEAFCYTGGFGIHAALSGARSVLGLDVSEEAVAMSWENARLNGVEDRCRYEVVDAFEALRALGREGARFDLVILDPPAFARAKRAVPQALAGYKEINLRALRLLRPGGFLVTCSCSSHVDEGMFWQVVLEAARDAGCRLRLVEARGQARDHPMLGAMPETRYLKCFLLQRV